MPTISFTQNLKRHLSVPRTDVQGATVRDALESVLFEVPDVKRTRVRISADTVRKTLKDIVENEDLSRYIL